MSDTVLSRLLGTLKSTFRINKATINASGLTVARTVTLPDASLTVAGLNVAQQFTAVQTFEAGKFRMQNRDADAYYTVEFSAGDSDPGAERTISFQVGAADRIITINGDVTLPQAISAVTGLGASVAAFLATPTLANFNTMLSDADMPTAGLSAGKVVALTRGAVRY